MAHTHIIDRFYPERSGLAEAERKNAGKTTIKKALKEIKKASAGLPAQAALDIGSAVMDIEDALAQEE